MTPGYSGTPLARKLGIREGSRVFTAGAPRHYRALLAPLPEGVRFRSRMGPDVDIAHVFATRKAELAKALRVCLANMAPSAALWVSWPKRAAKVATDVTEGTIRELALPLGLVDIKVCAVDEVWSGLKLVLRKANRPAKQA